MAAIQQISLDFDPYKPWTRGILRGIEAFAKEVPDWRLLRHRMIPGERIRLNESASVDGMISVEGVEWAKERQVPLVRFGPREPEPMFPVVRLDYAAVGEQAAGHLIGNGYPRLALLELQDSLAQDVGREQGFVRAAGREGIDVAFIRVPAEKPDKLLTDDGAAASVIQALEEMEKPVGLFARKLAEVYVLHHLLLSRGFRIPDEVGLIAGGNDRELLEALQPPVTSVSRNSYETGYRSAEVLHRLMNGGQVDPLTVVPPAGVVDRGSARRVDLGDAVVERARELIRETIADRVNVDGMARELGVSGRSLRRRFQAALRHSPVREIQLARLERARELLDGSRASILEIAHACGFAESCQLSSFFKSETGMTPTGFRGRALRERAGQRA